MEHVIAIPDRFFSLHLDVNSSSISEEQDPIDKVIEGLSNKKKVAEIDLNNKNINNNDLKRLVDYLERNVISGITCLNLRNNCIDDRGMVHIVRLLSFNLEITHIYLSKNRFTSIGISMLREVLNENCAVVECNIGDYDPAINGLLNRNIIAKGREAAKSTGYKVAEELRSVNIPKEMVEIVLMYAIGEGSPESTSDIQKYTIGPILEKIYTNNSNAKGSSGSHTQAEARAPLLYQHSTNAATHKQEFEAALQKCMIATDQNLPTPVTALRRAAAHGWESVVITLLRTTPGLDINHRSEENGWTALHVAVIEKKAKVVEVLLQAGASKDIEDFAYRTAAAYAADCSDSAIQMLFNSGKKQAQHRLSLGFTCILA